MDLLEGFEYLDFDEGKPYMRVSQTSVTFSKAVTEALGKPEKVIIRVDSQRPKCIIQGVDVDDPRGVDYYSLEDESRETITWHNKELARDLGQLGGLDLCDESYIFPGYSLPSEDAVMFDAKTAVSESSLKKKECGPQGAASSGQAVDTVKSAAPDKVEATSSGDAHQAAESPESVKTEATTPESTMAATAREELRA